MSSNVGTGGAIPISVAAGAATTLVVAGPSRLVGVLFAPTAAVTPVVTFYDAATAVTSGTKLATVQIATGVNSQYYYFGTEGIVALLGISVGGTFTTLPFTVYYKS